MYFNDKTKSPEHRCVEEAERKHSWIRTIEDNFELWIREIESQPSVPAPQQHEPDLYSFYEELCVLRSEFRKGARRSHESFVRFGEILEAFDTAIKSISAKIDQDTCSTDAADHLRKLKTYLPMVELFERFKRIRQRLAFPPATGFFFTRKKWRKAWAGLEEGFDILKVHFEELLKNEGITAINTIGKVFDPSFMTAVEIVETLDVPPNTVLEEISGGYLYKNTILKLAEVKISSRKGDKA